MNPLCIRIALPALVLALLGTAPAHATLGEAEASVQVDRQQIRASVQRSSRTNFTVHELSTAGNGLVREYVTPAGQVYAVSWQGPFMPNLQQLLGTHFQTIAQSSDRQQGGRGHLVVHAGPVVFESGGRMRSFHGRAYLSNALPAGTSTDDIQ